MCVCSLCVSNVKSLLIFSCRGFTMPIALFIYIYIYIRTHIYIYTVYRIFATLRQTCPVRWTNKIPKNKLRGGMDPLRIWKSNEIIISFRIKTMRLPIIDTHNLLWFLSQNHWWTPLRLVVFFCYSPMSVCLMPSTLWQQTWFAGKYPMYFHVFRIHEHPIYTDKNPIHTIFT